MSKMPQISIRLDTKLKADAVKLADQIGFSFNDLVTVCLKKAIREKGIDLRITATSTRLQKKVMVVPKRTLIA